MLNLSKDGYYLLACSFGPDSMALFHMLYSKGYKFDVALVNYHLRKESDIEEEKLREICLSKNIRIYVKEVYDLFGKSGIEEKARIIRYSFFKELNELNSYSATLVAHNEDDLLETYMIQKSRNSFVNYYGIKEKNIICENLIFRPLLHLKKEFLKEYCINHNVPFAIDSTNLEDKFLRNKIRHQYIEKMSVEEREKLLQEIKNENEKLENIYKKISNLDLNKIESYSSLNFKEKAYALFSLSKKYISNPHLSKNLISEIIKIMDSSKPQINFKINDNLIFQKEYNLISFAKKINNDSFCYQVNSPQVLETPYFYFDLRNNLEKYNLKKDDFPITIRSFQSGDKILIKDYYAHVRRLFIDWKMPLYLRKIWPIFLNKSGNIIYIPRYQKDFKIVNNPCFYIKTKPK